MLNRYEPVLGRSAYIFDNLTSATGDTLIPIPWDLWFDSIAVSDNVS